MRAYSQSNKYASRYLLLYLLFQTFQTVYSWHPVATGSRRPAAMPGPSLKRSNSSITIRPLTSRQSLLLLFFLQQRNSLAASWPRLLSFRETIPEASYPYLSYLPNLSLACPPRSRARCCRLPSGPGGTARMPTARECPRAFELGGGVGV